MPVASAEINAFFPYILPSAPTCPLFTAELELRNAAAEMCERAPIWQDVVAFTFAAQGQAIPVASADIACTTASILRLTIDGREIRPVSFYDDAVVDGGSGQAAGFYQMEPDKLWLSPEQFGEVKIWRSVKPTTLFDPNTLTGAADPTLKRLPSLLLHNHVEALAAGTLARIMAYPASHPWSDHASANFYRLKFDAACNALSIAGLKGQQRAPLRTPPSYL